jgi:hypothetical protein
MTTRSGKTSAFGPRRRWEENLREAAGAPRPAPASPPAPQPESLFAATMQESDIFSKIERLADLQKKGVLSSEEFAAKPSFYLGCEIPLVLQPISFSEPCRPMADDGGGCEGLLNKLMPYEEPKLLPCRSASATWATTGCQAGSA